jgi:hypothetical protein
LVPPPKVLDGGLMQRMNRYRQVADEPPHAGKAVAQLRQRGAVSSAIDGVIMYLVTRRTNAIGIRIALGSSTGATRTAFVCYIPTGHTHRRSRMTGRGTLESH